MMMQMNAGGKALVMGTPHQWSLAQSLVQPNNLSTTPSAMNLVGTYPREYHHGQNHPCGLLHSKPLRCGVGVSGHWLILMHHIMCYWTYWCWLLAPQL